MQTADQRVAAGLASMATTLAQPGRLDEARLVGAEEQTRAALVSKLAGLSPRTAFSSASLQAFRQQHSEMSAYLEATGPAASGSKGGAPPQQ